MISAIGLIFAECLHVEFSKLRLLSDSCVRSLYVLCFFFCETLSLVVLVLYCINQVFYCCSFLEECVNCVHLLVAVPSSRTSSR